MNTTKTLDEIIAGYKKDASGDSSNSSVAASDDRAHERETPADDSNYRNLDDERDDR